MIGSFQRLTGGERRFVVKIADAIVEALNDYARNMESGEIYMRSGPDALRDFARTINVALIEEETAP